MNSNSLLKKYTLPMLAVLIPFALQSREVARFSMENNGNKITETISGDSFSIHSVNPAENVAGAKGDAMRFDGYSTYIDATVGEIIPVGSKQMTASIWFAIETYPIVEIDVNTTEHVAIATCLDETAKTGFGFFIGFDGKYSFKTYIGGWPLEMKVDIPLRRYEWINLTAVIDTESRTATLYNNGEPVATSKANGSLTVANSALSIGRSLDPRNAGPFCLTSFNGIIDDFAIWDEALGAATIAAWKAENDAVLAIPESRFAEDPMRPQFHGMPGANWTNETHGMTYSNGRYHLFFQKNANGPYMARLHWGHLSSKNLYDWTEEEIAIAPGEPYDIKGCWSGCVFTDDELTGGRPDIIYTAVDYAKAVMAHASPADDNLISWNKKGVIVDGRPDGLSDDFRDPYFFRTSAGAYIIVGSSKDGVGTTTLHSYNPASKSWSNDGKTFFTGTDKSSCGTFWEMPNVTRMGDKWLFTVTPLNTSKGVAALYWTGTINADGTFNPDRKKPSEIELPGFARDGYGLLSPTVYQHEGKTIALGIVPDKLPSQDNYNLGYAHTYSLPREWSIDSDGNLCQRPYSGLAALRGENGYLNDNMALEGSRTIEGIGGRTVELLGEFTIGTGKCGFSLLDDGETGVKVYYDGTSNEIVVDARGNGRLINDAGIFDGYYHSPLPQQLAKGEKIKINVFLDHSILDIFINDRWATSVRVFAHAKAAENVTLFSDFPCMVESVAAWNLNTGKGAGIDSIADTKPDILLRVDSGNIIYGNVSLPASLAVFDFTGRKVMEQRLHSGSGSLAAGVAGMHVVTVASSGGNFAKKLNF